MRAFKKALMAFAAVTAVTAAFAATSFAADLKAEYADGKVAITAGLSEGISGQMTVLLIPKGAELDDETTPDVNEAGIQEGDILYINQATANTGVVADTEDVNATFGYMGVKGGELKDGWYTLMVGSDADGFTLMTVDFEVKSTPAGREIQLGECDGITAQIDIGDVSAIMNHITGYKPLTGDNLIAAECDGITAQIDIGDVSAVMNHITGYKPLGKVTVTD